MEDKGLFTLEMFADARRYWLDRLSGELKDIKLFSDFPRGIQYQYKAGHYKIEFENSLANELLRISKKNDLSLYVILLTVFKILLFRYSGETDIIAAASTLTASNQESNTCILLRDHPHPAMTFRNFLMTVKETVVSGYKNQFYPFRELINFLNIETGCSLFRVVFLLENIHKKEFIDEMMAEYGNDILFTTRKDNNQQLTGTIIYNSLLFGEETIQRLADCYFHILTRVLADTNIGIGDIEIITEKEREKILFQFNNTDANFPADKTIHQLFAEQVEQTPDYIAAVGPLQTKYWSYMTHMTYISYRELNLKSNQLAHLLIGKGVQPDTIVGIMIESSIEMIIGLLGILKAGGVYLPIDPEYPEERINYMLTDSAAKILVTSPVLSDSINNYQLTINNLQLDQANLAYIIYTSGTTGRPKGVPLQHRSVVNTLLYRKEEYQFNWETTALQLFSYAFDGFVTSFFTPVISGAKVILLPGEKVKDIIYVKETIVKHRVTQFISVPSLYRALLENAGSRELAGLKLVTLAGDRVSPDIVNLTQQKSKTLEISIEYGVTEAAVMSTRKRHQERHNQIKIGSPIWNTWIFIINPQDRMQPIGVPGEMCIGGIGVAPGYLNNPELTAVKFDQDFWDLQDGYYRSYMSYKSYIIYKTGDLARWLSDGDIEFLGRIDHQVKIRGFRIELGEVETRLLKHENIKDAVVISKADEKRDQYLCAYIIAKRKAQGAGREEKSLTVDSEELRAFLAKELPVYMIPGYFIQLEKIPLTPNGKIDRNALPPVDAIANAAYTAPRDAVEEKLARIWAEVLDRDNFGIDDNFFHLGGHSLKATLLLSKVYKKLGVKIPLDKIFEMVTIRELAGYIKKLEEEKYESIEPVEEKEYYPLSPAQKRLFILQQVETWNMNYNVSEFFVVEGELERDRFEWTFKKLIHGHESLRTSFHMVNDKPVQKIHQYVDFEIEYDQSLVNGHWSLENCQGRGEVPSPIKDEEEPSSHLEGTRGLAPLPLEPAVSDLQLAAGTYLSSVIRHLSSEFIRPFDLSQAPLLRVGLIHTHPAPSGHPSQEGKKHKHLLMVDMHHIITDGTSIDILIKDFLALYAGKDLPPPRIRCKDYVEWQQCETQKEKIKKQEAFWLKEFAGDIPVLELPVDYPRSGQQGFEGRVLSFEIGTEVTASLKALADTEEVTLFMLLLAVFNILLWKISGTESIVVGTPAAGRGHADLEGIIGMFVHTLALRNEPRGHKTFSGFLKEVKEKTLAAFKNQEYPFENVVEKVKPGRDSARNPIFDVMFALQNMEMSEITIPGLTITPCDYNPDIAQFDMYLTAEERKNRLIFKLGYAARLFKKETVESFFRYFREIIENVTANKDTRLKDIEISQQLLDPGTEMIDDAQGDFGFQA